jgi:transcriptional regulator with XRE-family HTH domain
MRQVDPVMKKAVALFEASGKSLDQLGLDMGYEGDTARKAAWQFLNKTADPRLSMLRRFARALGVSIADLFDLKPGVANAERRKTRT